MNGDLKTGLLILPAAIAIIVLSYFYGEKAYSHVVDCNSQVMADVLTDDCPGCPKCPSVEACAPGYSCQPDNTVEQQQYPPAMAEAWVLSIVDGALTDVSLNDPRWGGREPGEVYARESEDAIVWWWPHGGEATFNPTILDSKAMWHDYRIASAKSGGGGPINLRPGMGIQFRDSGGGVSIFKRVSDKPPPDGFFAPYANPKQAELPANGIYPMGQRMLVSAYATSNSQRRAAAAAGFSADGPHYHGRGSEDKPYTLPWTLAQSLGMKGYYRLRSIGTDNSWGDVVASMKTPKSRAKLTAAITGMVNDVLSNPELNDFVDAWYGFQEEVITRSSAPVTEQRDFHVFVHKIIESLDVTKKRPYYVSERRDSGEANLAGNACFQDGTMKQDALIENSGYTDDIEVRGIMRQWAIDTVKTAADADKKCPSYTGKPRAAIATLSSAQDPTNPADRNEAWLRNIITYDVYTQLAMGIDGFNIFSYGWKSHSTAALQQKLYNEVLGGMIKAGLGEVFLWGQDRDDVTKTITSGPTTMTWKLFGKTHIIPSIDMRNIQYGEHRYILLVNNSKETVLVRLSGIPTDAKVTDLISGEGITPTIPALGVRMYKIVP